MKKNLPGIAGLIASGLVANHFGYPIFFSADYLFGSIFFMLALQLFGLFPAIIAALVISIDTIFLASHPYCGFILAGEILVVGWCYFRKGSAFVLMDALYWLIIGMPLGYYCSRFVGGLHPNLSLIYIFSQAINGITNALVARLLFMLLQVRGRGYQFSLREVFFNLLALFMLIPALAIFAYETRHDFEQFDSSIRTSLHDNSRHMANSLNLWLHEKIIRVSSLAWRKKYYHQLSQENLDSLRELDQDLTMVGVIDKNGISTGFSPAVDALGDSTIGLDFSDRPYIAQLKKTLQPQLTDVVVSKIGEPEPIVVLASPIVVDGAYQGYAAGIFNIHQIRQILSLVGEETGLKCTLVDNNGLVIASTRQDLPIMAPFVRGAGESRTIADGLSQWSPALPGRTSRYERWRNAVYIAESKVGSHGEWKLIVEQAVAPHQRKLSSRYATQLETISLVLLLAMGIAALMSRIFLASFGKLHDISLQLQDDVALVNRVSWPVSMVSEVNFLIGTVKEMATLLIAKIHEISLINEGLEARIAERTRQLEELNTNLETQVEEEVAHRQKQEQLLVQQAKLAAMGEMLGAIAHQWRQPLNTLALCVQNIKDSYRFGDLNQEYLDSTVGESMAQITQMSRTIDDFRNFFSPDKETTRFDAMVVVCEVLNLFSAQLRVHNIRFVLSCLTHRRSFDRIEDVVSCPEKEMVGHKNEFKHVILNLISNAKDAICARRVQGMADDSESGCIFFDFSTTGREVRIAVRDNGIGIPSSQRDRVFEPYFTTKGPGSGTGIGLYLSKIIIEDHFHGRLTVAESEQGASFVIIVPAAKNER